MYVQQWVATKAYMISRSSSFTLHATQCGSWLHEHQKNEIHLLNIPVYFHLLYNNSHTGPKVNVTVFGIFRAKCKTK